MKNILDQIPDLTGKSVMIIGCPTSGKTHLSNMLQDKYPDHNFFHTDDYIPFGYNQAMYKCMDDVLASEKLTVVEGVQGYRMLRKGCEWDNYHPDIIIELVITTQTLRERYHDREEDLKDGVFRMIQNNEKVLNDFKDMGALDHCQFIQINND